MRHRMGHIPITIVRSQAWARSYIAVIASYQVNSFHLAKLMLVVQDRLPGSALPKQP
jgi:hypothetical protein